MPSFTPPTRGQSSLDPFWGRFEVPAGESVVKVNTVFTLMPYPAADDLKAAGFEGTDWFLGGRTYTITDEVATALERDGFSILGLLGYGEGAYGFGPYGG